MTIIIYDTKNRTMYADSLVLGRNGVICGTHKKIYQNEEFIIGFAGNLHLIAPFINYIETGEKFTIESDDRFEAIVKCKKTKYIGIYDCSLYPTFEEEDFYFAGSGSEMARMAIHLGKTPVSAIEEVSKLTVNCNDDVLSIAL